MRFRLALLLALMRHALPVTLPAAAVALLFLLTWREPLVDNSGWPFLFVIVHCMAVAQRIDSFHGGWFAFYRTRGFTSASLATHGLAAVFGSVLVVWGLAAALIWTGWRSEFQDTVVQSPYGPFLGRLERGLPPLWLGAYAVFVPVFHYALVRRSQPTRGMENGLLLALGFAIAWGILLMDYRHSSFQWIIWPVGGAYACICLIGSLQLHRRLEVRA